MTSEPPPNRPTESRLLAIASGAMVLIGAVWFTQGIGWLKGSFMTGDDTYTYVGGALVVVGAGLAVWNFRSRFRNR